MTEEVPYPDFIIVGAMKAGTTTVHHLLAEHDAVFIPSREIGFFDVDNFQQRPDVSVDRSGELSQHQFQANKEQYLSWYRSFFSPAGSEDIIGEDSTTYLASDQAPARIARHIPDCKIVILLRDPVDRSYSHYWHLVRTGRAFFDFQTTLRRAPRNILQRSYYKTQIERYLKHFSREQLKIIFFQDLVETPCRVVENLRSFLSIDSSNRLSTLGANRNRSRIPRLLNLGYFKNWLMTDAARGRYQAEAPAEIAQSSSPPFEPEPETLPERIVEVFEFGLRVLANRLFTRPGYPEMEPATRDFLQEHMRKQNEGLSELIDQNVSQFWRYFK
jgi:hypothetical protein